MPVDLELTTGILVIGLGDAEATVVQRLDNLLEHGVPPHQGPGLIENASMKTGTTKSALASAWKLVALIKLCAQTPQ